MYTLLRKNDIEELVANRSPKMIAFIKMTKDSDEMVELSKQQVKNLLKNYGTWETLHVFFVEQSNTLYFG